MSEYWVSKKKYFCKYCEIYIADDVPSRQHHENGLRHKGNVERFIRGIYKAGEKKKKDQEEEKREMARVEQAAQAAFAQDVSTGHAKASSAPVASTSTQRKPATKPSNPYANYSTAAQLGFTDPDAEKLEIRKTHGVVGDWEVVESTPAPPPEPQEEDVRPDIDASTSKRPAEAPPEDDTRTYKLRRKAAAVGLGEIYDPGLIPIKLKKKEDNPEPSTSATNLSTSTSEVPKWTAISLKPKDASNAPPPSIPSSSTIPKTEDTNGTTPSDDQPPPTASRWTKVQWGQPLGEEEAAAALSQPDGAISGEQPVKTEVDIAVIKSELDALPAETEPSTASLFKKRKGPGGAGRGRRQM